MVQCERERRHQHTTSDYRGEEDGDRKVMCVVHTLMTKERRIEGYFG